MITIGWLLPALMLVVCDTRTPWSLDDEVDLIELNHFHDDLGRHVYDQVIFYEWAADVREFHVRAWCLVDMKDPGQERPWYSEQTQQWIIRWLDKDHRVLREVTSLHYRETWTQEDPERVNKKKLDERLRFTLMPPPYKPSMARVR